MERCFLLPRRIWIYFIIRFDSLLLFLFEIEFHLARQICSKSIKKLDCWKFSKPCSHNTMFQVRINEHLYIPPTSCLHRLIVLRNSPFIILSCNTDRYNYVQDTKSVRINGSCISRYLYIINSAALLGYLNFEKPWVIDGTLRMLFGLLYDDCSVF